MKNDSTKHDYTITKEDMLFDSDSNNVWERLSQFSFRSFGDGLSELIDRCKPAGCDKSPEEYLKYMCEKNGVEIDRNTIRNWFDKDIRPKKGGKNRELIVRICFALELSEKDSKYLFERVYFDRYLYTKDMNELIFRFCIRRRKSYTEAKQYIDRAQMIQHANPERKGVYTTILDDEFSMIKTEEELFCFLQENEQVFSQVNVRAKELCKDILKTMQICENEKEELKKDTPIIDNLHSYLAKICFKENDKQQLKEIFKGKNICSTSFLINYINGITLYNKYSGEEVNAKIQKNKKNEIKKKKHLCDVITSHFPSRISINNPKTTEELRKLIILLASVRRWYDYSEGIVVEESMYVEDYIQYIDELLYLCGLPELYYGNPYDWFFIFCTYDGTSKDRSRNVISSLDTYRDIIGSSFLEEEEEGEV